MKDKEQNPKVRLVDMVIEAVRLYRASEKSNDRLRRELLSENCEVKTLLSALNSLLDSGRNINSNTKEHASIKRVLYNLNRITNG